VAVDGWATRPLTEVAAAVQMPRADLAGAYAKWQPLAAALTARLWPRARAATMPMTTSTVSAASRASPRPAPQGPCAVTWTGPGGGFAAIPARLILTGSTVGNQAAGFAMTQLGKPYVWGSSGPDSWDCSSLTQAGWASAGRAIPRTTFEQVNAGAPVGLSGARSGDLVFLAGSDGTATSPGHVGMVAGRVGAVIYLVSAPHAGEVVQMTPAPQWASAIVSVRRIG
jgi:peptidoglycan DL-endopeptidase CwlO